MDQLSSPSSLTGTLSCAGCPIQHLCLPGDLSVDEHLYVDSRLVSERRNLASTEPLYEKDNPFKALYMVRTGFFKCTSMVTGLRKQITGFPMSGDLLGMDGLSAGHHSVTVTALERSEVCVLAYDNLLKLSSEVKPLQDRLHRLIGGEIARNLVSMVMLGSMHAEARLAAFLLQMTQRLAERGQSGSSFMLHMSREEIGGFLGLTVETVSRTLSKLQADGLVMVHLRHIRVADPVGLQALVD